MKSQIQIISMLLLFLLLASCSSTRIYIVRHAEKSTEVKNDPPLSVEGEERAIKLAEELKNRKIESIFSTETQRTVSTAKPLADMINKPILFYSNDTLPKFLYRVLEIPVNTLIVGHSNTILKLLYELELAPSKKIIAENEYDNLFIITLRNKDGRGGYKMHLNESRYGKTSSHAKK